MSKKQYNAEESTHTARGTTSRWPTLFGLGCNSRAAAERSNSNYRSRACRSTV